MKSEECLFSLTNEFGIRLCLKKHKGSEKCGRGVKMFLGSCGYVFEPCEKCHDFKPKTEKK